MPADYREKIRGVAPLADNLFNAHTEWLNSREHELDTVKLGDEISELLTWCSRIGMAYALENRFHELSGGDRGTVCHGMNLSGEALAAAEKGAALVQATEYENAIPFLLKAADAGHAPAQYGLAMLHIHGLGTKRDPLKAVEWLSKAAGLGLAHAQQQVSILLFNGVGCNADPEKAFYWANKAAAQNLPEAVFNVGMFYMKGVGVAQNFLKAIEHIGKAADLGHPEAIEAMREMGDKGR